MPEYLAPGVYIQEVPSGPPPIAAVGTSTAGFVGVTRRGPIEGPPTFVTSYPEFVRAFGGVFDFGSTFDGLQYLPSAMRGFFDNGGRRAFVARVAGAGAAQANVTLTGGIVTRLAADTVLTPVADRDKATLRTVRGLQVGTTARLRMVRDGVTTTSAVLTITAINRDTGRVTFNNAISTTDVFEAARTVVLTNVAAAGGIDGTGLPAANANPTDPEPNTFTLQATSPGVWGRDIAIAPAHVSAARSDFSAFISGAAGNNRIQLVSTAAFYVGAWVEIDRGNTKRYRRIAAIDGPVLVLDGGPLAAADFAPEAPATATRVSTCEFALSISYQDPVERVTVSERYDGLTLENIPGRYYVDQLAASNLVQVTGAAPAANNPLMYPCAADGLAASLSGGSDVVPTDPDVLGVDNGPNRKTGLLALEDVDEIAILAAPGLTSQAVQNALKDQCERLMDRFAVLDPVRGTANTPATLPQIQAQRSRYDTEYAALYYPRVVIDDPLHPGTPIPVPPSGHILGVYARVDNTRGVHKAPANEVLRGILGVETVVSRGTQELLNPLNINVIRDFTSVQRGYRIFGARCATSAREWNYVNVRRLFIFIEESLDEGTQWAVFEPNDERLWARLRDSVTLFLTSVWRDGALMGSKPEEAFFVRVDRTTMFEDDILNGRLIMEIGIAPVRPAEFVIIRIAQWLGGSSVQEI
ncbi:phage tail sheath family protein [Solirubrobacter soli]|uniref:phage tail sheath family protein n=1 Tax=Solirubrobacter soli TaxID=363832 RepID=UPI000427CC82|nr:phage tail sheath C-terminal domain-containing protein [Solirubrobacter soli]